MKNEEGIPNLLSQRYNTLLNLPLDLKTAVCEECGWSIPTFYRKLKGNSISKAEREKIDSLFSTMIKEIIRKNDS